MVTEGPFTPGLCKDNQRISWIWLKPYTLIHLHGVFPMCPRRPLAKILAAFDDEKASFRSSGPSPSGHTVNTVKLEHEPRIFEDKFKAIKDENNFNAIFVLQNFWGNHQSIHSEIIALLSQHQDIISIWNDSSWPEYTDGMSGKWKNSCSLYNPTALQPELCNAT